MHGTHPDRTPATNRDRPRDAVDGPATPASGARRRTEAYEALRDPVANETAPRTMSRRPAPEFDEAYSHATADRGVDRDQEVTAP